MRKNPPSNITVWVKKRRLGFDSKFLQNRKKKYSTLKQWEISTRRVPIESAVLSNTWQTQCCIMNWMTGFIHCCLHFKAHTESSWCIMHNTVRVKIEKKEEKETQVWLQISTQNKDIRKLISVYDRIIIVPLHVYSAMDGCTAINFSILPLITGLEVSVSSSHYRQPQN